MTPGTIKVINKNLLKQRNDKQKIINEQKREIANVKGQNRVLKQYADGKISKKDLKVIVEKQEKEESELNQVKLRKVKIEKIKEQAKEQEIDDSQPKSIKNLLSIFGGSNDVKPVSRPMIKRTVTEDGNIGKTGKNALRKAATTIEEDVIEDE